MAHDITLTFEPNQPGYRGIDHWRIHCTCDRFGPRGLTSTAITDGEARTRAAANNHAALTGGTITTIRPPTPGGPLGPPHPIRY